MLLTCFQLEREEEKGDKDGGGRKNKEKSLEDFHVAMWLPG